MLSLSLSTLLKVLISIPFGRVFLTLGATFQLWQAYTLRRFSWLVRASVIDKNMYKTIRVSFPCTFSLYNFTALKTRLELFLFMIDNCSQCHRYRDFLYLLLPTIIVASANSG